MTALKSVLAVLALSVFNATAQEKNPVVEIKTSAGTIKAVLFQDKVPMTVENFLKYAKKKHYDGTIFHRVIKNFMIQGGGFAKAAEGPPSERPTDPPIKNESTNDLKNDDLTLAMARRGDPNSATSQFFINTKNNNFLNKGDAQAVSPDGYCVFGKVIAGEDVVRKIESVRTGRKVLRALTDGGQTVEAPMRDVPQEDVIIESITLATEAAPEPAKEPAKDPAKDKAGDGPSTAPPAAPPAPVKEEKKGEI